MQIQNAVVGARSAERTATGGSSAQNADFSVLLTDALSAKANGAGKTQAGFSTQFIQSTAVPMAMPAPPVLEVSESGPQDPPPVAYKDGGETAKQTGIQPDSDIVALKTVTESQNEVQSQVLNTTATGKTKAAKFANMVKLAKYAKPMSMLNPAPPAEISNLPSGAQTPTAVAALKIAL